VTGSSRRFAFAGEANICQYARIGEFFARYFYRSIHGLRRSSFVTRVKLNYYTVGVSAKAGVLASFCRETPEFELGRSFP
jgi:hypothetical protein